jgi:hypothetical protein
MKITVVYGEETFELEVIIFLCCKLLECLIRAHMEIKQLALLSFELSFVMVLNRCFLSWTERLHANTDDDLGRTDWTSIEQANSDSKLASVGPEVHTAANVVSVLIT